jgi:hypothetical protein
VIRLGHSGGGAPAEVAVADPAELRELQGAFAERHHVVIPGLFAPDLLGGVQEELDRAAFDARDYDGLAGELTLDHTSPLVARLLFLLNDPALHRAVGEMTGTGPIVRFDARIYRRLPVREHYDNWHDDLAGPHRVVTMSVNLGSEPYAGGELLLRRKGEGEPFASVHNVGPGDALLFRIDPGLEHRVTSISSGVKTALAGWFGTAPPWPLPVSE